MYKEVDSLCLRNHKLQNGIEPKLTFQQRHPTASFTRILDNKSKLHLFLGQFFLSKSKFTYF